MRNYELMWNHVKHELIADKTTIREELSKLEASKPDLDKAAELVWKVVQTMYEYMVELENLNP